MKTKVASLVLLCFCLTILFQWRAVGQAVYIPSQIGDIAGLRAPVGGGFFQPIGTGNNLCKDQGNQNNTTTLYTAQVASHTYCQSTLLKLIYINAVGSNPSGYSMTIRASIEYPANSGTTYPVWFAGPSRSAVLASGASATGECYINLPANVDYDVRTSCAGTTSTQYPNFGAVIGSLGTDTVDGGTESATVNAYGPMSVIGLSGAPHVSLALEGDSIVFGLGDGLGYLARACQTDNLPYVKIGTPSELASSAASVGGNLYRDQPLVGCTHAICEYGTNDIAATFSLSALQSNLLMFWSILGARGMVVYQTTITPRTTSTDSWATTTNQSVQSGESVRVALNNWIRDGAPITVSGTFATGYVYTPAATGTSSAGVIRYGAVLHPAHGYLEAADVVETSRNSGIWQANFTSDGVHPNSAASSAIGSAVAPTIATFHL